MDGLQKIENFLFIFSLKMNLTNEPTDTFTLTFGEQAENHKGMEILGDGLRDGLTKNELLEAQEILEEKYDVDCEFVEMEYKDESAYVLVARKGVDAILGRPQANKEIYTTLKALDWDKQAFMYGRVVNKNARHNLCFGLENREPEYEKGKGRIVEFPEDIATVRRVLPKIFGSKAKSLQCEGNYYYDITKCGIGYHGDTERRVVIGARFGGTLPLYFRWYEDGARVHGDPAVIELHSGDLYAMSEKTSGNDWKRRKFPTLRHAAGCAKFVA